IISCCFFSSRRRHTRSKRDWSSDVCSSDLVRDGKPVPVDGYAALIKGLLGITLSFPNREKLWDMFLLLKNTKGCETVSGDDVFRSEERRVGKECRYRGAE